MLITAARMTYLCPHATVNLVAALAPALEEHRIQYGIASAKRAAYFMGQVAHESAGFERLEENLNYSAERISKVWPQLALRAAALAHNPQALANAAHADHLGNGNEASGDGWRFKERGLIKIAGRSNYKDFGTKVGVDIVSNPDSAAEPASAARLALAYWNATGCNERADLADIEGITRRIAGAAMQGIADRQVLTTRALAIFI